MGAEEWVAGAALLLAADPLAAEVAEDPLEDEEPAAADVECVFLRGCLGFTAARWTAFVLADAGATVADRFAGVFVRAPGTLARVACCRKEAGEWLLPPPNPTTATTAAIAITAAVAASTRGEIRTRRGVCLPRRPASWAVEVSLRTCGRGAAAIGCAALDRDTSGVPTASAEAAPAAGPPDRGAAFRARRFGG